MPCRVALGRHAARVAQWPKPTQEYLLQVYKDEPLQHAILALRFFFVAPSIGRRPRAPAEPRRQQAVRLSVLLSAPKGS